MSQRSVAVAARGGARLPVPAASRVLTALATVAAWLYPTSAHAGWFVSPEVKWSSFSFEPTHAEPTPNFYAWGLSLDAGYSVSQVFDLGVFGQYLPGRLHAAEFGKGDASLVSYGGELAWRIADTVYVGLRGGASQYDLNTQSDPSELAGHWGGPAGGLVLGAVTRLSKTQFLQTTFELMESVVADQTGQGLGQRRIDQFALGLGYVFNGEGKSHLIESGIFRDFLNTLVF